MKLLHVFFEAVTATFKIPFTNSGTAMSSPVPSYSNIVGLISCCAGRPIEKDETLIGFKYDYEGIGKDIEITQRLGVDGKGKLKKVNEKGIITREFHVRPKLEIFLSNLNFKDYFYNPRGVPTLGRSQDIAWITKIEEINALEVDSGKIKPTLIPFPCEGVGGRVLRLCDYFNNTAKGYVREPEIMILYQVIPKSKDGIFIKRNNLYLISDNEVIYLHEIGRGEE